MNSSGRVKSIVVAAIFGATICAPAASQAMQFDPNPNPWRQTGFLNMAHQGGEDEAPSNTLFAFRTAMADRGADMLELDVNMTSDNRLVVIHNDTVNSTTEETRIRSTGFSEVNDLTLAEVQALDGAYSFREGGIYDDNHTPVSDYPYRGMHDSEVTPTAGYAEEDFRHPTIEEVLDAFPDTPINIEIKMIKTVGGTGSGCQTQNQPMPDPPLTYCDDAAGSVPVATALAGVLNDPAYVNRNDIIVVSFAQDLVNTFHQLAPQVAIAPALTGVGTALVGGTPSPDVAAFQIPPRFTTLYPMLPETLLAPPINAHARGYAVHVFTENAADESDAGYRRFYCAGVDGVMSSQPGELDRFLRENNLSKSTPAEQRCQAPAAPIVETPPAPPPAKAKKCKKQKKGKKKGKGKKGKNLKKSKCAKKGKKKKSKKRRKGS